MKKLKNNSDKVAEQTTLLSQTMKHVFADAYGPLKVIGPKHASFETQKVGRPFISFILLCSSDESDMKLIMALYNYC